MPRDAHGHLIPGRLSPARPVPNRIPRPEYVGKAGPAHYSGTDQYDADGIRRIREAGRIAAGERFSEPTPEAAIAARQGPGMPGRVGEQLAALQDAIATTRALPAPLP